MQIISNLLPKAFPSPHWIVGSVIIPAAIGCGIRAVEVHPLCPFGHPRKRAWVIIPDPTTIDVRIVAWGGHAGNWNGVKLVHPVRVIVVFALDGLYRG